MKLRIRVATKKDLSAILALYAQPDLDNGKVLPFKKAENIFLKMQTYPNYSLYVAITQKQIVGTFALLVIDNLGHLGTPSGIVEDVAVAPAYQRHGIGKLLMQFAIKQCKKAGCYKVVLSSNLKRKKAHQFYDSLGFKRHGYSFLMEL